MPDDVPPIVAPPPPPPSEATRRVIFPGSELPLPSPPDRPRNRGLIAVGAVAAVALIALTVALLGGRDNGKPTSSSSAAAVAPASSDPANLQPGRPAGVDDPPAPASPSPMVGLRHVEHVGFDRVAVDFHDALPPRIHSVETDATLGRVRVVLDQPRPTESSAPRQLDVARGVVRSVVFVVDATRTYVDVYTSQPVDTFVFRLANVAFTDGSVKGVVVIDLVPSSNTEASGGTSPATAGG